MNSMVKMFSDIESKTDFVKRIRSSSMSDRDCESRVREIRKMFSCYDDISSAIRNYSGHAETSLSVGQYFNATVNGLASSFSGYLSVERSMEQARAFLVYVDTLGIDLTTVMPNLGAETLGDRTSALYLDTPAVTGTGTYSIGFTGKKVLPGSVKGTVFRAGSVLFTFTDDKSGFFLVKPTFFSAGTVTYSGGAMSITAGAGYTPTTGDTIRVEAFTDAPGDPTFGSSPGTPVNRYIFNQREIEVNTRPDLLAAEGNLLSIAAVQKATGMDMKALMIEKLSELYTKQINKLQVEEIRRTYTGNTVDINISPGTTLYQDYRSQLDQIIGQLVDVDTALATKSVKGVKATAYLCGKDVAGWLAKTKAIGRWTENTATRYINDLYGYIDGIPVLRHTGCSDNEGFAIHKTEDGAMAPLMRGIYLPLMQTPDVGNYNNPTQLVTGTYYQEGNKAITDKLTQRFTITRT